MKQNGQIPFEDAEQETLAEYLDLMGVCYTHVPNGGNRSVITGSRLKRQGVKKGVPDILIFDPPPNEPDKVGTAIELKRRKGGRVSKEQKEWLEKLSQLGWVTEVCKGADEAIELIKKLGYGRKKR